jgi:hypothetical protein
MVDSVLLPLLGLVIALIGVFFDAKSNPRSLLTVLLIGALLITAAFSSWSAWDKGRQSVSDAADARSHATQAERDKKVLNAAVEAMSTQLKSVNATVVDIRDWVVRFGIRTANAAAPSPAVLQTALVADEALQRLASPANRSANSTITVQIFSHQLDREVVAATVSTALATEGFKITSGQGNPKLVEQPTNVAWYGPAVPDESIRTVALALVRAGIQMRGLAPFDKNRSAGRSLLIQVGADLRFTRSDPLTVDQINSMPIVR